MNRHDPGILSIRNLTAAVLIAVLASCASTPQRSPELVRLETELARMQADPVIAGNAARELSQARRAVEIIASDGRNMRPDLYDHNIYLADRLLQIAEAEGRTVAARRRSDDLAVQREQLVADARSMEAAQARQAAEQARQAAEQARAIAEAERRQAQMARIEAESARAELMTMREMLTDLQARQTERGLVVTLGDVLFETDRAEIKAGARRNLDKLVEALRKHPDTTLEIEGHTDSTGSASYNRDLSRRRADAVASFLTSHGIDRSRLVTRGLGQEYPVASNEDASGRQQNRRVEIIIQDNSQRG
jgi:outer membrane protein OmpA-like peptidoglycan-associated protein